MTDRGKDTREQLELDVTAYLIDKVCTWEKQRYELRCEVERWLDRQDSITRLETMEHYRAELERRTKREAELKAERDTLQGALDIAVQNESALEAERDESAQRIQTLEREIATLKEHRAANVEKLHELTDECAELRKYRDEWKGLAEKYRADSIAAQAESERYRAKLGDVLDALHEAERAAR